MLELREHTLDLSSVAWVGAGGAEEGFWGKKRKVWGKKERSEIREKERNGL